MRLVTECPHCRKPLGAGEVIERFCETCKKPAKRPVRGGAHG